MGVILDCSIPTPPIPPTSANPQLLTQDRIVRGSSITFKEEAAGSGVGIDLSGMFITI